MDMDEIFSIFPTPVLVCNYPDSYEKELEYIKSIEFYKPNNPVVAVQSEDNYILNNPELKKIRNFIQIKLNKFSKEILKYEDNLNITQSWINLSSLGKTHNRHSHPNSIISGVWYAEISEDSSPIRFHNSLVREISLNTIEANEFNGIEYTLMPKKSNIIFFPSNLHHDVLKNESDSIRISLSFNSWPEETFGNKLYLTSTSTF
jgi:uncharacterized protein (TIGR02466 family)